MKQYYHSQASAIMLDDAKAKEHVENDIDDYEQDLQDMLQVCVFVSLFVCMYINHYSHSQAGAVMLDDAKAKEHVQNDIHDYEADLQEMLQVCAFVSSFVCMYMK